MKPKVSRALFAAIILSLTSYSAVITYLFYNQSSAAATANAAQISVQNLPGSTKEPPASPVLLSPRGELTAEYLDQLVRQIELPEMPIACRHQIDEMREVAEINLRKIAKLRKFTPEEAAELRNILLLLENLMRINPSEDELDLRASLEKREKALVGEDVLAAIEEVDLKAQARRNDLMRIRESEEIAAYVAKKLKLSDTQYSQMVSLLTDLDSIPDREISFYTRKLGLTEEQSALVASSLSATGGFITNGSELDSYASTIVPPVTENGDIDWERVKDLFLAEKLRPALSPAQLQQFFELRAETEPEQPE